jgi:PLD-like domain
MKRTYFRWLSVVVCVVLAQALLLPVAAFAFSPDKNPRFNQPRPAGNPYVYRIVDHLVAAIRHVPGYVDGAPRPEIKIGTHSHNLQRVNDALIAAQWRGVSVQMVQNNNAISAQTRELMRVLGRDRTRRSVVHVCDGACRGAGTLSNQHAKMYLFSRSGTARNVVMTGSANTTTYAAKVHWNDHFTVVNAPNLHSIFRKVFLQMTADDGSPNGYLPYAADGLQRVLLPQVRLLARYRPGDAPSQCGELQCPWRRRARTHGDPREHVRLVRRTCPMDRGKDGTVEAPRLQHQCPCQLPGSSRTSHLEVRGNSGAQRQPQS